MKRYINRAKFYSYKYEEPIFRRRILKKFSYKGAKRNRKVVWNEAEKNYINMTHIIMETI